MRKEKRKEVALFYLVHIFIQVSKGRGKYTHKEIMYWRTEIEENISKQWPILSGALYT